VFNQYKMQLVSGNIKPSCWINEWDEESFSVVCGSGTVDVMWNIDSAFYECAEVSCEDWCRVNGHKMSCPNYDIFSAQDHRALKYGDGFKYSGCFALPDGRVLCYAFE
jgi:hypothetical protein